MNVYVRQFMGMFAFFICLRCSEAAARIGTTNMQNGMYVLHTCGRGKVDTTYMGYMLVYMTKIRYM